MKTFKIRFTPGLQLYLSIILLYLINSFLFQLLQTPELLYNTYESTDFVEKIIEQREKYWWVAYVIVPAFVSLKLLIITLVLNIGVLVANVKVKFAALWKTAIIAEFSSIAFSLLYFFLIYFGKFTTLNEIQEFNPLALSYYINKDSIPNFFHYPFAVINVSEMVYWIVLALALKPVLEKSFSQRLGFVAKSYGVGLLLWVTLIVFLTINM